MIGEQLARRIEAEPGTGPRRRVGCAKEAPADARKLLRRNADAAVADPDDEAAPVIVRVDLDRAIRIFERIVDEVDDGGSQHLRVGEQAETAVGDRDIQAPILVGHREMQSRSEEHTSELKSLMRN